MSYPPEPVYINHKDEHTYGSPDELTNVTELDDYQTRAMRTNFWPRVFTEQQVRDMLVQTAYWFSESEDLDIIGSYFDQLLDQHTTSFNRAIYQVLGACEEFGELAGHMKKCLRDDNGVVTRERKSLIKYETGDAAWYVSAIAAAFDWSFSEVARANLQKLEDRARRGVLRGSGDKR